MTEERLWMILNKHGLAQPGRLDHGPRMVTGERTIAIIGHQWIKTIETALKDEGITFNSMTNQIVVSR